MAKKPAEPWFDRAAELIVREGKTLPQIVSEMQLPITSREAAMIEKRKEFQQALWVARNKYHKELAETPGRSKTQAIGLAVYLVQKLVEEGKFDKAIDALMKLAKLEGWTEPDQQVNVFGSLSQKDLETLRERVKLAQSDSITPLPN